MTDLGALTSYRPPSDCRCCHGCGTQDGIVCWPESPALAYCPECCPDHEYSYDCGMWSCDTCGAEPPDDWFDVDDVCDRYERR